MSKQKWGNAWRAGLEMSAITPHWLWFWWRGTNWFSYYSINDRRWCRDTKNPAVALFMSPLSQHYLITNLLALEITRNISRSWSAECRTAAVYFSLGFRLWWIHVPMCHISDRWREATWEMWWEGWTENWIRLRQRLCSSVAHHWLSVLYWTSTR